MNAYETNLFAGLVDSESDSDENLDEMDLLEILKPEDYLQGQFSLEWQEIGILHKIGELEILETRTFAYDDLILGNTTKSMCRLKDFLFLDDSEFKVGCRELEFETSGVGFRVWDASVVLAVWIHNNANLVKNKSVVEIGSGCGLGGLAATVSSLFSTRQAGSRPRSLTSFFVSHFRWLGARQLGRFVGHRARFA